MSEGKIEEIKFIDFDLETECCVNRGCIWNIVMVHEGEDDDGDGVGDDVLLHKNCNNYIPVPFTNNSRSKSISKPIDLIRRRVDNWFILNYNNA